MLQWLRIDICCIARTQHVGRYCREIQRTVQSRTAALVTALGAQIAGSQLIGQHHVWTGRDGGNTARNLEHSSLVEPDIVLIARLASKKKRWVQSHELPKLRGALLLGVRTVCLDNRLSQTALSKLLVVCVPAFSSRWQRETFALCTCIRSHWAACFHCLHSIVQ